MFKDYDKYLTASLKVYLFVLICIFILKLSGLDYFGLDYELIKAIDKRINIVPINYIIQYIVLYFQLYLLACITEKRDSNKVQIALLTLLNTILSYLIFKYKLDYLYTIMSIGLFYLYFKLKKIENKRIVFVIVVNSILQILSNIIRNNNVFEYNFTLSLILNVDYMIMLLIWNNLIKGGATICQHHGSSSLKKVNLKKSLKKLQKNWRNFKKLDKITKLTNIIYFTLSLFWNLFNVALVLFVAILNDTFIECIFILTSFWLTKGKFGKAFHFKSMGKCFIVSNLSYYVLNRLTTPLGISIIIPIMLGVGLSYVTSKFVKKTYKPLYRGMSPELFEETILQVTDKDSHKYKICYDFYINKKSIIALSMKYNYTEAGIRKIKDRINKQIKGLN